MLNFNGMQIFNLIRNIPKLNNFKGVSISSITILTALHQQEAMCLSPYTTSDRYMFWSSIGRFFGPLIMGKILADYSIQMLVNLIFICLILMIVAFYYFSANITSVARHQQLQDLKMDISGKYT